MGDLTLVTGASGFIGQRLCGEILRRGGAVRVLVRKRTDSVATEDQSVAQDLSDRPAIRAAMDGVTTVVHLAARVHQFKESARDSLLEYRRVNVEGTRTLLEESVRAGVKGFVFASSVKAVTSGETTTPLDETSPTHPTDPYGVSKREAEEVIGAFRKDLRTTILRLPLVYGPGVKANMLRLFRAVDRGLPLPFGLVQNKRSLVFVGNVVDAAITTARMAGAGSETFFVSDGPPVSTPELVRAIAFALRRKPRLLPVPPILFRFAGAIGDALSPLVNLPINSDAVGRLLGSLAVDSSKLGRLAAWVPPYSMEEGLLETAKWYRAVAPVG